jgi:hypothetical protein
MLGLQRFYPFCVLNALRVYRKEHPLTDSSHTPGRKWRHLENDGDGDKYFDNYRYTPYTTDAEFFRDPNIYEADEVARVTQHDVSSTGMGNDPRPRGERPADERMKENIQELFAKQNQIDAGDIQVDVRDGLVTLLGIVKNQQEKWTAERIARNAFGILEVNNQLSLREQE